MSVEVRIDVGQQRFSFDGPPPQSPALIALEPGERLTILASLDGNGFELERQRKQAHSKFNFSWELGTVSHGNFVEYLPLHERIVLATLLDNMHSVVDVIRFREALYPGSTDSDYSRQEMHKILKVHIARIRRKLPEGPYAIRSRGNEHYIHSFRGLGPMLYDPKADGFIDEIQLALSRESNMLSSMS